MSSKSSQYTMTISATDRASSAFRQVAQSSKALGQEIGTLDKALTGIGGALSGALGGALGGGDLFAAAGGVLGGISATASLQEFGNFEKALWETTKVTDQATAEIKKKMMEIPAELGSATELTTGYYQIISAGITDPVKAMEMLVVASQTAKAAGVEQATAVNALGKVMNAYGHDVLDAATASNMFFTTEKLGMTNVRELAPLMGDLAGMAKSLGVEYYDLAGSMALITQTSGSASEASTRLRSLMSELAKPAKDLQEAYDAMGIVSFESLLQEEGWAGALRKIEEGAQKTGKSLAQTFSSQEAYQGFLKLMKDNFAVLQAFGEEIKNTNDALDNAFSGYTEIREAQYSTLASNFANLSIRAGENFRGIESSGLDILNASLTHLNKNFHDASNNALIFGTALTTLIATKKLAGLQLGTLGAQYSTFGGVVMQTSTTMSRVATLAKGAGASLLSAFGGPVGVAVTALGAGMAYLATRESEAERAARLLDEAQRGVATALDASTKAANNFSGELGAAAKLQLELAESKAVESAVAQWELATNAVDEYVKSQSRSIYVGKGIGELYYPNSELQIYVDTFDNLVTQLQDGAIESEQFDNKIALFIEQLLAGDQAAKGFGESLKSMVSEGFFSNITRAINDVWRLRRAQELAAGEFMGPLPATPQTKETKPRTFVGGGSGDSEAKRKAEEAARALEALNEKYDQLTMTERAFEESQLVKWINEQLQILPAYEEKILATAAAQRELWAKEDSEEADAKAKENLDVQLQFYEQLIAAGGEYAGLISLQNQAIAAQAEAWKLAGIPQEYINQMTYLTQLQTATDWSSGLERGFLALKKDVQDTASLMEDGLGSAINSVSSSFTTFLQGGAQDFKTFTNSLLQDLLNLGIQMMTQQAIKSLFSMIGGAFSFGMGGGVSSVFSSGISSIAGGSMGSLGGISSFIFHDGGVVGSASAATRTVPMSTFDNAPRLHSGGYMSSSSAMSYDERPAILQTGENVISRVDSGNLGAKLDQIASLLSAQQNTQSQSGGSTSVVLVDDQRKVKDYLLSPEGGKTFVTMLNNNRQSVQNISNGGRG